ncbi:MAG: hypothetical protein AUK03_09325 [Anaerolineae bacterium CG2_30_64_16]|nr:MAG: hypothetical protein AUK03_09325 [Anaerolineae bacterium CG2_30_64_16]
MASILAGPGPAALVALDALPTDRRAIVPGDPTGAHVHDFMSYGGGDQWISPYTYRKLFDTLRTAPTVTDADLRDPGDLEARDRAGQTGVATVELEIIARSDLQPVADAGPDQTAANGCAVALDGSGSRDDDGDRLAHLWSIVTQPAGSAAWFSDPEAQTPRFFADRAGAYEVELVVHDGRVSSVPDHTMIHVGALGASHFCTYLPLTLRIR